MATFTSNLQNVTVAGCTFDRDKYETDDPREIKALREHISNPDKWQGVMLKELSAPSTVEDKKDKKSRR